MNQSKQQSQENAEHYIVVLGASAGGLEAIHDFFDNMAGSSHLSFVIVQHLSADYKSLLVELIARHTAMQVFEAEHNQPVMGNTVYVIPNNKLLGIKNGKLQLSEKSFEKVANTAIDTFLFSLAKDQGSKAIAIILSGTGTDGSKGIQAIHQAGGLVMVQDPLSAKFDGMPNAAIATGLAELILSPELMPEEIFQYTNEEPLKVTKDGRPNENSLPEVLKLVETHCRYDFNNYKSPTILRRISRRMGLLGIGRFNEYLELLRSSGEECKNLGKEFLIGVTKFFRDEAAFQILREQVLPQLFETKKDGDLIKVWVTACSTGEEAYSMGILLNEFLERRGKALEIKIFATDIDPDAIETASKAMYLHTCIAHLDERLQKKYFIKDGSHVVVQGFLRKQIVFARHNILKDPPFIKNDLASCRNMLIYMNSILQRRVLSTLQFSLNTGGYLFLGPSETLASAKEHFEEVSSKWKIFRKITSEVGYNPERLPSTQNFWRENRFGNVVKEKTMAKELSDDLKNLLVKEYGYAAIYIDRNNNIKEAVGDFRKYLSLSDSISSMNVVKMVSPQISAVISSSIRKAVKENTKVVLHGVRMMNGEEEKSVNIFIRPAPKSELILIVFEETRETLIHKQFTENTQAQSAESVAYVSELEEELKDTRVQLQMAIEGLETANEELQSSNEELLSANEELQSSNEELQSLNEELHTVNAELQMRIKELVELNDDLENYFGTSEVAQVFVDRDLRIRKFNSVAIRTINLIPGDVGRPIEHISTNIKNYPNFLSDLQKVQTEGGVIEKEVIIFNGTIQLVKMLPYVRKDKTRDGVVLTFTDITNIKELDNTIKTVFNASLSAIMSFTAMRNEKGAIVDLKWTATNYATDKILHLDSHNLIGKNVKDTAPELFQASFFDKCVAVIEEGETLHMEVHLTQPDDGWYEVMGAKLSDGIVLNVVNITEKRNAEEKLKRNYQELIKTKENLRNLNIGLEQKISDRTKKLSQSEERFRLIAGATNDAIWDWDLAQNEIWWSDSFYKTFGWEQKPETHTFDFWLQHIHPDDVEEVRHTINDVINKGSTEWMARFRFQKKEGTYAAVLTRGTVIKDANGITYRMAGAMMDLTELNFTTEALRIKNKELQTLIREFSFVTDFMPQLVWATGPDGYHDFYNKGWYDYTGLTYEQTKGEGWNSVLHPEDQERAWKVWRQSLDTGEPYQIEYRFKRHDGMYRWFLGRALPMHDDKGDIIKWFGTCTDIHDQKTINDVLEQRVVERTLELQKSNAELEESNHELLQFASVASHDLKEPLRKIHLFSNLLHDKYFPAYKNDEATDYLKRIITASSRMTKLINDLLSFTRLSVQSDFEKLSLQQIVQEVLSDLELLINEKGARFEIDNLPEIDGVSGQLRQVFQNIISNALKFSKEDTPPLIRIKCERVAALSVIDSCEASGAFCRITISDNGIGFDNQYSNKIFAVFQRLHGRGKYDGTGIGLAITRKIIERHNGIITAKGKPGEGSSFTFVLPLSQTAKTQMQTHHKLEWKGTVL